MYPRTGTSTKHTGPNYRAQGGRVGLENRARVHARQPRCRRDNRILRSPSHISHALRAYSPPSRGGHTLLSLRALPFHRARYSNSRRGRSQWSSVWRLFYEVFHQNFCSTKFSLDAQGFSVHHLKIRTLLRKEA